MKNRKVLLPWIQRQEKWSFVSSWVWDSMDANVSDPWRSWRTKEPGELWSTGLQRVRQDLATEEPQRQQSASTSSPATESRRLYIVAGGFLDSCFLGEFSMGTGHGQNVKEWASRVGEYLLPAPTQQVHLKPAVRLDPDHTHSCKGGQLAWPPLRVWSLPPLCCSSGLGLVVALMSLPLGPGRLPNCFTKLSSKGPHLKAQPVSCWTIPWTTR